MGRVFRNSPQCVQTCARRAFEVEPAALPPLCCAGLCTPGVTKIMHYDASIQQSGVLDLQRCMEDAACLSRMTLDPLGKAARSARTDFFSCASVCASLALLMPQVSPGSRYRCGKSD